MELEGHSFDVVVYARRVETEYVRGGCSCVRVRENAVSRGLSYSLSAGKRSQRNVWSL